MTQKLSYIRSLGFTGIWLTPIFESPTYHKYNATDYFTVDSQFGTNDDLKTLVDTAHDDGIKVILDLALNHSSTENEWFQESVNAFAKEELGGFSRHRRGKGRGLTLFPEHLGSDLRR
uniref:Alpha-amylase n=1 Tax=uncultured Thermosipho sp. TaxID=481170 RepID=A0A060BMB6_9BACT|nr:alpha-amylase [uncultured Thermosipho sp.]